MSAKRSQHTKMMKRAAKQADQYQATIDRQKHIIDRLTAATLAYGDLAYAVEHDAKTIKEARKFAHDTLEKVKVILAVPSNEEARSAE